MSQDLIENFLIRTDTAEDWDGEETVQFHYNDMGCVLKSIDDDTIYLQIGDNNLETSDIDEAVRFFYDVLGIDEREQAIHELESELRETFDRG